MNTETSNAREWVDLLERAMPFLHDEGAKYDDDGSNEPLELAREIETLLASLPSDESALSSASLAFDGGREATPCPHTRYTNCDCAAPPPAAARGDVVAWADLPWRAAAGWLRSASGSKIMEVGTHEGCISQRESELIAAAVNSYATAPPAAITGERNG